MPRPKVLTARVLLKLPPELKAQVDALLADEETRVAFIRVAIEREIAARKAPSRKKKPG